MDNINVERKTNEWSRTRRRKKAWQRVLAGMMAVVVFSTTYALILPAITKEQTTFCGHEEHEHTDACYERVLICGYPADEEGAEVLLGGGTAAQAWEGEATDETDPAAFGTTGSFDFAQDDSSGAQDDGNSGAPQGGGNGDALPAVMDEGDEAGTPVISDAEDGQRAVEDAGPYEGDVTPGEPSTPDVILSGGDEVAAVEESRPAAQEGTTPAPDRHVHSDECYELRLSCEAEEHVHSLACFSDPEADLETEETWHKSVENIELTGVWADDVLTVAKSQLGQGESENNYKVNEHGDKQGYTRYGAWWGEANAYDPWCAMFVSFCLDFAEVDKEIFPQYAGCAQWQSELKTIGLWRDAADYTPKPGDVIFFDFPSEDHTDLMADHVGLVFEIEQDEDGVQTKIVTVEGNNSTKVEKFTYDLTDDREDNILGYGALPKNPELLTEEERAQMAEEAAKRVLTAETEDGMLVTLTASEDSLPYPKEELRLVVTPVEDEAAQALVEEADQENNSGEDSEKAHRKTVLFDIKIMRGDEEVQPLGPVSVSFSGLRGMKDDAQVYHVDPEAESVEAMPTEMEDGEVTTETDHFSYYAISYTYTVDFYYGDLEFHLAGGTSILLSDLFEKLDIELSLDEIADLSFTSPNLLRITRHENGDWLLESLAAFTSREVLTVTLHDGESFEIVVLDAITTDGNVDSGRYRTSGISGAGYLKDVPFFEIRVTSASAKLSTANTNFDPGGNPFQIINIANGDVGDYQIGYVASSGLPRQSSFTTLGSLSLTVAGAAELCDGQKAPLHIRDTIRYRNTSNTTVKTLQLINNVAAGPSISSAGFGLSTRAYDASGNSVGTDVGIEHTLTMSVPGAGWNDFLMLTILDVDQPGVAGSFSDSLTESFELVSGHGARAYLPKQNEGLIKIENAFNTDSANGLRFKAVEVTDKGDDWKSGFAALSYAPKDGGSVIRYTGSRCGIGFFGTAVAFGIKPVYRPIDANNKEGTGTVTAVIGSGYTELGGGNVGFKDSERSITWREDDRHTTANFLRRFMYPGHQLTLLNTADHGFRFVEYYGGGQTLGSTQSPTSDTNVFGRFALQHGTVTVTKTDNNGAAMSEVGFTLTGTAADGSPVNMTGWTNANGKLVFKNVPVEQTGTKYTLREFDTPSGYFTASDQKITINAGGDTPITIKNEPGEDSDEEYVTIFKHWDDSGTYRPAVNQFYAYVIGPAGEVRYKTGQDKNVYKGGGGYSWWHDETVDKNLYVYRFKVNRGEAQNLRVYEDVPAGYQADVAGGSGNAITLRDTGDHVHYRADITNTEMIEYIVAKVWNDNKNAYGIRPANMSTVWFGNANGQASYVTDTSPNVNSGQVNKWWVFDDTSWHYRIRVRWDAGVTHCWEAPVSFYEGDHVGVPAEFTWAGRPEGYARYEANITNTPLRDLYDIFCVVKEWNDGGDLSLRPSEMSAVYLAPAVSAGVVAPIRLTDHPNLSAEGRHEWTRGTGENANKWYYYIYVPKGQGATLRAWEDPVPGYSCDHTTRATAKPYEWNHLNENIMVWEYGCTLTNTPTKNVTLKKVDAYTKAALSNAKFDLFQGNTKLNSSPLVSSSAGTVSLGNLTVGKEYRLVETSPPNGYPDLKTTITIKVNADGVTYSQSNHNGNAQQTAVYDATTKVYTITAVNHKGGKLPEAGGPGEHIPKLFGLAVMLGAAGVGVVRRRRRKQA